MEDSFLVSPDGENWKEVKCAPDEVYIKKATAIYIGNTAYGKAIFQTNEGDLIFGEHQEWMVQGREYEYRKDPPPPQ
jgi:hypothetical protein